MRRRPLSSWLVPTFGGALASAWTLISLAGIFGRIDPLLGGRFGNWVASMMVFTPITTVLAVLLLASDIALRKWRAIPLGPRGWAMSATAPPLVFLAYLLWRPGDHDPGPALWFAIFVPLAGAALATRWYLGTPR